MFYIYGGNKLTRSENRCCFISFFMIVLNGIFLVMKFHSIFKDHYKAKLIRGLTLKIFAIILNFIGIIFQLEIGNRNNTSSHSI